MNKTIFFIQLTSHSLIGYLFARFMAFHFGITIDKSIFDIAFSLPFLVMALTGFTFLYSIVATSFSDLKVSDNKSLSSVFSTLVNIMLIAASMLCILCYIFSYEISQLIAPGFSGGDIKKIQVMIIAILPITFTFGIGSFLSGIFTAYNIPITTEFGLLISRILTIIYFLLIQNPTIYSVAISLNIFSIFALLFQFYIFYKYVKIKYVFVIDLNNSHIKIILKKFMIFLIISIIAQLNQIYQRALASIDGESTVASLTYGYSIIVPIGIILGKFSFFAKSINYIKLLKLNELSELIRQFSFLNILAISTGLVVTVVFHFYMEIIISFLYKGGSFDSAAIQNTLHISSPLIYSIPAAIVLWINLPLLLELSGSKTAPSLYCAGYLLQIALNFFLFPEYRGIILSWSFSISLIFQAIIGYIYVSIKLSQLSRKPCLT